jgi:hypothetical protein
MADKKISQLTAASTPLAGTEVLPIVQSSATVKVSVADLTAGRSVSANGLTSTANVRVQYSAAGNVSLVTNNTASTAGAISQIIATNDASRNLRIQYTSSGGAGGSALTNGITTETGQIYTDGNYPLVLGSNVSAAAIIDTSQNVKLINNLIQGTAAKGINFTANTPAAGKTSQLLNWYEEGTWTPSQGAGLTVVGAFTSSGTYTRIGRQVTVSGTVTGATSVAVTAAGIVTTNLPFTVVTAGHGNATNAAVNASAAVICTTTNVTSASAIAATGTITFSATYFV